MQQELKQVYRYGFGLLALAACFLLLTFLLNPYPKLLLLFQQFNAEKETLYPWNDFSGNYGFTEKTYWLAIFAYSVIAVVSLLLYFRNKKRYGLSLKNSANGIIRIFFNKLISVWQKMSLSEKWLVSIAGILLFLVRLYFLFTIRIGGDEAASYIFFISKGLPGILFYYPLPNNHVFYNLLCLPLSYIFNDPFWIIELPAFFLSMVGSLLVYLVFRSVFPFLVVFFAVATFYFSQYALYFSVHGRGYFLVSICAALIAYALFKIHEQKKNYYWLIFLVFSIIGFFTIPIFLYPFAAVFIFGLCVFSYAGNWPDFKNLIVAGAFTGVISLVLYSPALLASGELLFKNRYVASRSAESFYTNFPFFFTYTQGSVVGQESVGFYFWLLGFVGVSLVLIFHFRLKHFIQEAGLKPVLLFLIWCNLILPWVFIFIQRVRPPERVLFYKGFFDLLAVGIVLYLIGFFVLKRWPKLLITVFLVFIAGFSAYEINKTKRKEEVEILENGFDARLQAILKSGAKVIYANEIYYSTYLRYEYFKQRPEGFVLSEFLFNPAYTYEVVILDQKSEVPAELSLRNYQIFYKDQFVQIYFLKDFLNKNQVPALKINQF